MAAPENRRGHLDFGVVVEMIAYWTATPAERPATAGRSSK
jgi:hypothetical protein